MNAGKEYIAPPRFWFVVHRRDGRDGAEGSEQPFGRLRVNSTGETRSVVGGQRTEDRESIGKLENQKIRINCSQSLVYDLTI
jgi:hypothetical protein